MDSPEARDLRLDDPEADLRMVSTDSVIRYLPQLLYYPLRGYALPIVVVMGAWLWLCGYAGVFGIPAAGILFGWMGHYFMGVVERTATGHAIPPPLGTEVLFQGDKLRLTLLVVYLTMVLGGTLSMSRTDHPDLSILVFVVGVYLLPAFVAGLALQPTALDAFNPVTLLLFVLHTGVPYLFACLALAGVGFLAVVLAGHVAGAVTSMLTIYVLMFVCHLVGFVSYHRHEELNLAVAVAKPTQASRAAAAQAERMGTLLALVDKHLDAHEPRAARDAILAEDAADVANPRLFHEDLFEALRSRHQDALSLVQGGRLMQLLMRERRLSRALDIYELCLDLSPEFDPAPLTLVSPLAEQAVHDRRLALFGRFAAGVSARHPDSDAAASVQFLKARLQAEQKQDAAALALLTPLLGREAHPWYPRIQALHKALSGLQKPRS